MRIYQGLFVSFLFISLIFGSCSDYEPSEKTFIFTGQISAGNAVPAALFEDSDEKRSALPSFGNLDYYAFAKRKDNSQKVNAKIENSSGAMRSFTLSLSQGEWIIECGLKDRTSDVTAYCSTKEVEIADEDTFSNLFILKPRVNGSGRINLPFAIDDAINIDDIKLINVKKDRQLLSAEELESFYASLEAFKTASPGIKTKDDATLPAGIYEITINFMRKGYPVYSLTQSISVFADFTTNKWISSSDLLTTDNSGKLELTVAAVSYFTDLNIYVGSVSGKVGDDDYGSGTAFAPYATLGKALQKIQITGKPTSDYVIRVAGSVKCNYVIESSLNRTKANSIMITGANSNSDSYKDVLDGDGKGSTLTVSSAVPVILKNIKVTGAKSGEAGLVINYKSDVTFDSGVYFTGNGGLDINANENFKIKSFSSLGKLSLAKDKKLIICGDLGTSGTVATFDMSSVKRRTPLIGCDGEVVTDLSNVTSLFSIEDGWTFEESTDKQTLLIDSPIYVAGQTEHDVCPLAGSDSDNEIGSKLHPFATIKKAVSLMDDLSVDYQICVAGTLEDYQEISSALGKTDSSVYKAKSVTLKGSSASSKINRKLLDKTDLSVVQTNGNCLTIATEVPVTILKMVFENGYNDGNGGGIYISKEKANVTIGDGTVENGCDIKTNGALNGGGIYNKGTLILTPGVNIYDNKAVLKDGENGEGGGVYSSNKFVMSPDSSKGIKASVHGNEAGGNINNNCIGDGGGVFFTGVFEMQGGDIYENNAYYRGGGVYNYCGRMYMSGKAVVGGDKTGAYSDCSNTARNGGGIYTAGSDNSLYIGYILNSQGSPEIDKTFSGTIKGNYASEDGGGVYSTNATDIFNFAAGKIESNGAGSKGQGVYFDKVFTILGSACVVKGSYNDVYVPDSKTVTIGGPLSCEEIVAKLTPSKYEDGVQVISAGNDSVDLGKYSDKFKIHYTDEYWIVQKSGEILRSKIFNENITGETQLRDNNTVLWDFQNINVSDIYVNYNNKNLTPWRLKFTNVVRSKEYSHSALTCNAGSKTDFVTEIYLNFNGDNRFVADSHYGLKFYGSGKIKVIFDTESEGRVTFTGKKSFGKENGVNVEYCLADGVTFEGGEVGMQTYSDFSNFTTVAETSSSTTMKLKRNK